MVDTPEPQSLSASRPAPSSAADRELERTVEQLFLSSEIRKEEQAWRTAGPLDGASLISQVILPVVQTVDRFAEVQLASEDVTIFTNGCYATYAIDSPSSKAVPRPKLVIELAQFDTEESAQSMMKSTIRGVQGDLTKSVTKSRTQLGYRALETGSAIFWVRDSTFVCVNGGPLTDLPKGKTSHTEICSPNKIKHSD